MLRLYSRFTGLAAGGDCRHVGIARVRVAGRTAGLAFVDRDRAVRPAACACLQAASASGISRRRVGGYGRARVRDGRRVFIRGTARPGGDCCICRGAKPSGLACLPAFGPQTVTAGLGLEAQGLKPRRNLNERYPRGRLNRAPRRRTC